MKACLYCKTTIATNKHYNVAKYCSNRCQKDYEYEQRINKWLKREISGTTGKTKQLCLWVRRYIHETRGTACSSCGWDKRHPTDGSVLTEIDHIDGDANNSFEDNLRVLCPNCHAMTNTFRARNKKSSRQR